MILPTKVAQRSSTTIGPQSPLHSAWAFMYLYSEGHAS